MLDYKYDTQLLIEGKNLSEDEIHDYIMKNIEGDCLIAVGDEELKKYIFIPIRRGRCWNTAHPSGIYMTL